ncbi:MAG: phospholipid/cholesterol/gamma-HCH transport system substrate-binding protein [Nocardioidaceae bacterium]|jgi:phospholipid/cholesterol/gamma-HCH transport system substrate-binding protein|nr:phospholipid/cholesterol/gamma-HCH transport system substrate-binding protein [Nocardioidaceae bacterium]
MRASRAAWALLLLALACGCSTTLADVPLPGTGVQGDTVRIQADFDEALNLATGATVKVNGVDSGKVEKVEARDFHARATLVVQTSAQLREGATVRLRYTTPLGELFVDVTNPPTGKLIAAGALLTTKDTTTAPTVEDALSQASLLVNGGGLGQLETVTKELNSALGGREDTFRDLLLQTSEFLTQANGTTADVERALRGLSDVSAELQRRQDVIDAALRDIRPAARVLRQDTPDLTALLREVERFARSADHLVGRTRNQLLSTIREVEPVLAEIAHNKDRYAESLDALVQLSHSLDSVVPGDYLSTALDLHIDGVTLPDLGEVIGGLLDGLGVHLREGTPTFGGGPR